MSACTQLGLWPSDSSSGKIFRQCSKVCSLCDRSLHFTHYFCGTFIILCTCFFVPKTTFLETSCFACLWSGDISSLDVLKNFMLAWFTWVNSKDLWKFDFFRVCFFVLFCLMMLCFHLPLSVHLTTVMESDLRHLKSLLLFLLIWLNRFGSDTGLTFLLFFYYTLLHSAMLYESLALQKLLWD